MYLQILEKTTIVSFSCGLYYGDVSCGRSGADVPSGAAGLGCRQRRDVNQLCMLCSRIIRYPRASFKISTVRKKNIVLKNTKQKNKLTHFYKNIKIKVIIHYIKC